MFVLGTQCLVLGPFFGPQSVLGPRAPTSISHAALATRFAHRGALRGFSRRLASTFHDVTALRVVGSATKTQPPATAAKTPRRASCLPRRQSEARYARPPKVGTVYGTRVSRLASPAARAPLDVLSAESVWRPPRSRTPRSCPAPGSALRRDSDCAVRSASGTPTAPQTLPDPPL